MRGGRWLGAAFCAASCASTPPPAPTGPAPPALDLHLPDGQPEPEQLLRLPELWKQAAQRSLFKLELGPIEGAGNFDDIEGPLALGKTRNPYLAVEQTPDGPKLVERRPGETARKAMEEADKSFSGGKLEEAEAGYRKVIELDPLYPKAYFYVAAVLKQRRDFEGADAWIERGLRLSPKDAFGYAMRAEILHQSGKDLIARETLARAFALDPYSAPALRLLEKLGGKRKPGVRPPILVKRASRNELVARSGGGPGWRDYAICRALLTYDHDVRAEFLQHESRTSTVVNADSIRGDRRVSAPSTAAGVPKGALSPLEETTCGFLATATYRAARIAGGPEDEVLERWSKAFDAGLLREAVIYETLACRRPELLQLLPDDVQTRVVEYTRIFVVPARAGSGP